MTRSAPLPPVCPICQPAAFDGSLDLVPAAQFCGQHKGHVLRWVFERAGVRLERDAAADAIEQGGADLRVAEEMDLAVG